VQSWGSSQMLLNAEKKAWAAPECVDAARWSVNCGSSATAGAARLTFRPSAEVRRRNFARLIRQTQTVDPGGARELEVLLSRDVIGSLAEGIKPYGLRTDNVADAMTLYVMQAWEVITGRVLPMSLERAQALQRQMTKAVASTPTVAEASDAAKQETAETMMVQALLISSSLKRARQTGDAEVAAVRKAVRAEARAMLGFDLGDMTLTNQGLREGSGG
jgi:hypothetical protein